MSGPRCGNLASGDLPIPDMCEKCQKELAAEIAAAEEAYSKPPCQRCGAMTAEESARMCRVSGGDDDHCHGCELWPDRGHPMNDKDSVIKFLLGEGPLEGCWFGEKPETERGNFWWRKHLRAVTEPPKLPHLQQHANASTCAPAARR